MSRVNTGMKNLVSSIESTLFILIMPALNLVISLASLVNKGRRNRSSLTVSFFCLA